MRDDAVGYYYTAFISLFAKQYAWHITSSPRYRQANGAAVKTVKQLLTKNEDPYLALLAYQTSSLGNGYSPADLLIVRKLRATVPIISENLKHVYL